MKKKEYFTNDFLKPQRYKMDIKEQFVITKD